MRSNEKATLWWGVGVGMEGWGMELAELMSTKFLYPRGVWKRFGVGLEGGEVNGCCNKSPTCPFSIPHRG